MSAQRARSAVGADHRSAHPNIPGVPWWGAVLIAVTFTAIGFAFDAGSGHKDLSSVFSATYVVGCIFAVLAVRQAGVFTAVIQPPLLLFVSVPTAYFLFTGGQLTNIRDTLINCGYPLIERFPLMFFTSAVVLILGMIRWYVGMSARRATPQSTATETPSGSSGLASTVTSKLSSLFTRDSDEEVEEPPRRRRSPEAPARKPAKRSAPSRSRHTRPPETEIIEPVADRPRRTRTRPSEAPPVPPAQPRRRPRASSNGRKAVPPPADRRGSYERPERRRRYDDYEPLEPHGTNGNGTHHPISRVRYRGAEDSEERVEYRTRPRAPRNWEADNWEYDV